jgi:predicted CopG family antitoxin
VAKQIAISDDVYQLLLGMKGDDKSFSDVIRTMAGKKKNGIRRGDIANLEKFFGILSKKKADAWKKEIMDARARSMPRKF